MSDRAPQPPASVWVGGRYRLLGEVGRGGMATVHRAHDEVLDRLVAVKVLHPHLAHDPTFLDRFRREARSAAALAHPNVVAVHDWGETEDGAYLVLQLVEGCSLRDLLREHGRLEVNEALTVLAAAAAGLGAAHASGLVHRDVKPENLLIGWDGSVRITDFGLARAAASATTTFGPDVLVGSPHYLSPEAVRGQPLDPRADVYALGVVLYECLTGRPPHEGDSPYATAMAHTARPVPPPSASRAGLPASLDALVVQATTIDPAGRHPSASAFGTALATALPGTNIAQVLPVVVPADAASVDATRVRDPDGPPAAPYHEQGAQRLGDWTAILEDEQDEPEDEPQSPTLYLDGRRGGRGWLALLVVLALVGGSALGGYLLWDRVLAPVTSIPSVQGAVAVDATEQLRLAGFQVAVAEERPHDLATPAGHVLHHEPAGTARRGATVTVVLSAGPRQVEVLDVRGIPAAEAIETLRAAGLRPQVAQAHDGRVPEGSVIGVDPAPGTMVDEASEVDVAVSLGPGLVTLPDLRGERVAEAVGQLEDLGLDVEVERRGGFGALLRPDRVYDQDPAAHATLESGETVVLYAYE